MISMLLLPCVLCLVVVSSGSGSRTDLAALYNQIVSDAKPNNPHQSKGDIDPDIFFTSSSPATTSPPPFADFTSLPDIVATSEDVPTSKTSYSSTYSTSSSTTSSATEEDHVPTVEGGSTAGTIRAGIIYIITNLVRFVRTAFIAFYIIWKKSVWWVWASFGNLFKLNSGSHEIFKSYVICIILILEHLTNKAPLFYRIFDKNILNKLAWKDQFIPNICEIQMKNCWTALSVLCWSFCRKNLDMKSG